MKDKFRILVAVIAVGFLFSCSGNPKKELIKAHQKSAADSIHKYYEYLTENGMVNFAENGSVQTAIIVNKLQNIMPDTSGLDLSMFNGLALSFYANISKKDSMTESNVSVSQNGNTVSLLNLKVDPKTMLLSFPFTTENKTYFLDLKALKNKFADNPEIADSIDVIISTFSNMYNYPSEKDVVKFTDALIETYFKKIDVEARDGKYTYSVSESQSAEILADLYKEYIKLMKKYISYQTKYLDEAYNKFYDNMKGSGLIAYTVEKEVKGGVLISSDVNFDIDGIDQSYITMRKDAKSSTIDAKLGNGQSGVLFTYKTTVVNGKTDFNARFTANIDNDSPIAYTMSGTETSDGLKADGVLTVKNFSGNFAFDAERGKPKNNYEFNIDFTSQDKPEEHFSLVGDGLIVKSDNDIKNSLKLDCKLRMGEIDSNESLISMIFLYGVKKDRIRTIDFADKKDQIDTLELKEEDISGIAMALYSEFLASLQGIMGGNF